MAEVFSTCINKSEIINNTIRLPIFSQNTYKYLDQVFLAQIAIISLGGVILQFLLKPLGFTPFVAQILAGVILGRGGLGNFKFWHLNFIPFENSLRIATFGLFGVMLDLFLVGVKMDLSTVKTSSRKAWIMGITTFIVPLVFTLPLAMIKNAFFFSEKNSTDVILRLQLPMIAITKSGTSLHVVSSFLSDHKILNTELGRLATSVSTISGICSLVTLTVAMALRQRLDGETKMTEFMLSTVAFVIFIIVVLRYIVTWFIKHTAKGEAIDDIYVFCIFLMILGTSYIGEVIGLHSLLGPMILGLAIPDGDPVGSALTEKLECIVLGLFLPIFILNVNYNMDFSMWSDRIESPLWVLIFTVLAFLGKFLGTLVPCLFNKTPIGDSIILGFILSSVGIYDLTLYSDAYVRRHIRTDIYTALVISVLIVAGITSLVVHWLYNPSRKYIVSKNRNIQNAKENVELRVMVCIYNDENVPSIIDLLEASYPNKKSPMSIYALHLIELHGRLTPLFIAHQPNNKRLDKSTPSDHIINCFRIYEKQNHGVVVVYPYTTITPFVSAHEDICTMALDKRTSLIVIPFHKQWKIEGVRDSSKCRIVNKKVLIKAPCSVGILIDRGRVNNGKSIAACWSTYIIGVIFLGSEDDREALYYAMRMAERPNVHVVVHRLLPINFIIDNLNDKILDDNAINEYRLGSVATEKMMYKEEALKDGIEIVSVIRAVENSYDLLIVGQQQRNYVSLLSGLTEWIEYPELGFFGDMLASSDCKGTIPILVIQQHSCISKGAMSDDFNEE